MKYARGVVTTGPVWGIRKRRAARVTSDRHLYPPSDGRVGCTGLERPWLHAPAVRIQLSTAQASPPRTRPWLGGYGRQRSKGWRMRPPPDSPAHHQTRNEDPRARSRRAIHLYPPSHGRVGCSYADAWQACGSGHPLTAVRGSDGGVSPLTSHLPSRASCAYSHFSCSSGSTSKAGRGVSSFPVEGPPWSRSCRLPSREGSAPRTH